MWALGRCWGATSPFCSGKGCATDGETTEQPLKLHAMSDLFKSLSTTSVGNSRKLWGVLCMDSLIGFHFLFSLVVSWCLKNKHLKQSENNQTDCCADRLLLPPPRFFTIKLWLSTYSLDHLWITCCTHRTFCRYGISRYQNLWALMVPFSQGISEGGTPSLVPLNLSIEVLATATAVKASTHSWYSGPGSSETSSCQI